MAGYNLKDMYSFGWAKTETKGTKRDRLVKGKKGNVIYKVWGNPIANLNLKKNIVRISDAGWKTKLTKDRLNQILFKNKIVQKKGKWFLSNMKGDLYDFKGNAKFKLKREDVFN